MVFVTLSVTFPIRIDAEIFRGGFRNMSPAEEVIASLFRCIGYGYSFTVRELIGVENGLSVLIHKFYEIFSVSIGEHGAQLIILIDRCGKAVCHSVAVGIPTLEDI